MDRLKDNKKSIVIAVIAGALLVSIILNFHLFRTVKTVQKFLPYLLRGEKVNGMELVDEFGADIEPGNSGGDYLVFIFTEGCSPCNKNIKLWDKMADLLDSKIRVYGVILDDVNGMVEFSEQARLRFHLHVPRDVERFKNAFRIQLDLPQTIYVKNNKVDYLKLGVLSGDDYIHMMKYLKREVAKI